MSFSGIGPATSSGEKSASVNICARPAYLLSFEINPPLLGTAQMKVWDSEDTTTAGRLLLASMTVAAGENSVYGNFMSPRIANRGIYVELSGNATTYLIGYSLG